MTITRKTSIIAGGAGVLIVAGLFAAIVLPGEPAKAPTGRSTASVPAPTPNAAPPLPEPLSASEISQLPAAVYDAVIPSLMEAPGSVEAVGAGTVLFDSALYGSDRVTAVARIPATNFLNEPTVVVAVKSEGDWSLVLTASRQVLPSQSGDDAEAPAQTAAWIPTRDLQPAAPLDVRVEISVAAQELSITDVTGSVLHRFPVGVGAADTPTPTGVTGYLQARYLDPRQGQSVHRIQLTSLHATGADEPFGGSDGGLIGIHFQDTARGAVSHGCIRLDEKAIAMIDALPLGTLVTIVE